ncbi:MerR family transcriptional regulator [Streptococcus suis]|nr:MerR family transcriptional regulator [Streptococcus suis]MBY4970262.1 MerR family transcriptional regulator [Streptococcus suis]MBY5016739.1 MerR family transcriptional regulator [Streptococcus suis]MBY5032286.1 MerR family transcriptional regulator [Streptococcus suis]MBY5036792.1 MerR family transcriptional regulator [Streptococcus suis]
MKTMKEVAEELGLSHDTIRYYERIGLLQVPRDKNGYRQFDQQSIDWLFLVKMLRKSGMSIESLVDYVGLVRQGDSTIAARKAILQEQEERLKEQIAQQESVLEMLSHKVATYDSQLLHFEQERLDKGE